MPVAAAAAIPIPNSPIFSPSAMVSPLLCKPSTSSPLTLNLHHGSSSPSSTPSNSSSSPACLLSPLTLPLHSPLNDGLLRFSSSTSPTLLNRKRPARINIPTPSLSFPTAVVDGSFNEVEFQGDGYFVYCKRGKRAAMEDRYSALVNLLGDSKQQSFRCPFQPALLAESLCCSLPCSGSLSADVARPSLAVCLNVIAFFGVFDGHGGGKAAEFVANNLDRNIMKEVMSRCEEEIIEAVKDGYLSTDAKFLKEDLSGGTCSVTAMIRNGNLVVSNAGDCRAVLSRGGVAEVLTDDHRPSRKDERDRIENQGGYVDCCNGIWRIQGSLAVSRAFADRHLKQWVVAEPETTLLRITPECEFLILASDGLWDKVSIQEAVDVVRPSSIGVDKSESISACKRLVDLSVTRGSIDDISVMVILLAHFLP
ncbi:hypothetical protein TEA_002914 [Camellia sinensis var. sinensis]|uniref:protein-serine/threonine phosphatase n=1 Tax=Camellia sinensis var. sinensis TaxID=542762 RepID=A0A4S4EG67_CAMSN|nr:hypothetical protein TEA_002914 [Camellia sinensis var. sinensis]